jgi:hypothetical protein
MRQYFVLFLFACSCMFVSCEKEIMVKTPPYSPVLAVNGTVNVGDVPLVFLTKSVGVTEYNQNHNLQVQTARVWLYMSGLLADSLIFEPSVGGYLGHVAVAPGANYKLQVVAPGFDTVSAVEASPALVQLSKVDRNANARLSGDGDVQDEIRISFDDPAAPGDYYILSFNLQDSAGDSAILLDCVNTTDASVESIYDEQIDNSTCLGGTDIFFRDELFNGKTHEMRFFIDHKRLSRMDSGAVFTVSLRHVTEAYFRYRKSFLYASENAGNPFSEPIRVYSNVKGGYGIFGILNDDTRELQ